MEVHVAVSGRRVLKRRRVLPKIEFEKFIFCEVRSTVGSPT